MPLVSGSPAQNFTNFVATNTISVNCGSGSNRFVLGYATATNGDASGTRSLTSATYGGVALTLGTVYNNQYGKFSQIAYGITTLTGAQNFIFNATNDTGGMSVQAAAWDGVDQSTPLSGATFAENAGNTTASWTISSATGDEVVAMMLATSGVTLTPNAPASSINFGSAFRPGMTEAGAASVTIDGTFSSTEAWLGVGVSLKAAGAAAGSPARNLTTLGVG